MEHEVRKAPIYLVRLRYATSHLRGIHGAKGTNIFGSISLCDFHFQQLSKQRFMARRADTGNGPWHLPSSLPMYRMS